MENLEPGVGAGIIQEAFAQQDATDVAYMADKIDRVQKIRQQIITNRFESDQNISTDYWFWNVS